jgi:hypothetical protein
VKLDSIIKKRNPTVEWSDEENSYLISNINFKTNQQIADTLGKTLSSVIGRLSRMKLNRDKKELKDGFPVKIFSSLLKRARERGSEDKVDFDIIYLEELYKRQEKKCALTGWDILFTKRGVNTASVDRIDSTKEYTKDNIQIIHKNINRMKNIFSDEYFYRVCEAITKNRRDLQSKKIVYEIDDWNDTERIVVLSAMGEFGFEDIPENCYEYITKSQELNKVDLQYP